MDTLIEGLGAMPAEVSGIPWLHVVGVVAASIALIGVILAFDKWDHRRRWHGRETPCPYGEDCIYG